MAIKVAVIGAGSLGFTREFTNDILSVPELQDTEFAFMDIHEGNLERSTKLAERDIKANNLPAKITATTDRRAALKDADYVLNVTRIGGLDAFAYDIDIPLKYGIDQCVGDTLCAGGIMYGQRNIPFILDLCKDIKEVAKEGALFLSYANPMAMNTWAAIKYGEVNTIGLCHGVDGGHFQIANVIQLLVNKGKSEDEAGFIPVTKKDVDIICAGINHQTWYTRVMYKNEDWTDRLLEGFEAHPKYSETEKVRIDMIRRFGLYSTESNGHLSEYVPWYRKRKDEIKDWIHLGKSWINGETAGYLRHCIETKNYFVTDFETWMNEKPAEINSENRSSEHCSYIIEALETGRVYRGHFNVMNNGIISNLPDECIIEAPGYIDRNGLSMPLVGDLPLGAAAVCNSSIQVQKMAVEAAVHADVTLLKQAMMMDPLTGAVCNPPEIWQMTDEMLIAQAQWLPQYSSQMAEISSNFDGEKKLGTHSIEGAARTRVKSVDEMRGKEDEGIEVK